MCTTMREPKIRIWKFFFKLVHNYKHSYHFINSFYELGSWSDPMHVSPTIIPMMLTLQLTLFYKWDKSGSFFSKKSLEVLTNLDFELDLPDSKACVLPTGPLGLRTICNISWLSICCNSLGPQFQRSEKYNGGSMIHCNGQRASRPPRVKDLAPSPTVSV